MREFNPVIFFIIELKICKTDFNIEHPKSNKEKKRTLINVFEITHNLKNKTNVSFKIKKLNGLDGYPDNIQSDGSRKVKKK
jgi:hypothetical protein